MELTLTFNLGDRVRVTKGKAANKTGTVAGFDGSKVLVQSDNFPDAPPRRFDMEQIELLDLRQKLNEFLGEKDAQNT